MSFNDVVESVIALLERRGRVSLRALRRDLEMDEAAFNDLVHEVTTVLRLARIQNDILVAKGPEDTGPQARDLREGERRQVTVMMCDMVGSTRLSNELDPEALYGLMTEYQRLATAAIESVGGTVAQYLGDGIVAYFGWPMTYEGDGVSAVRASLRILEGLDELNGRLRARFATEIAIRIGVHPGSTVIGEVGGGSKREVLALGAAPNVCARIQALALPNTVYVSEQTYELVGDSFEVEKKGEFDIAGLPNSIRLYHVLRERPAARRFSVDPSRGLTPLVGRHKELELMRNRWRAVSEGERHALLIEGEAGIGKSRLVHFVEGFVANTAQRTILLQCDPIGANTPLAPISAFLHDLWTTAADVVSAIRAELDDHDEIGALLLAELAKLPLPVAGGAVFRDWSPQRKRAETVEAVARWLTGQASTGRVLLIVEDLHWADPSTIELLKSLIERDKPTGVMFLMTSRPLARPDWVELETIEMRPLDDAEARELVFKTIGGSTLEKEFVTEIVQRTDGIPLFIEELSRSRLGASGVLGAAPETRSSGGPTVPPTLYGILLTRFDNLGHCRDLAQWASLLGREIERAVLKAVSALPDEDLDVQLRILGEARMLLPSGPSKFAFRHALVRDAVINTLLRPKRQELEGEIARVLIASFPDVAAQTPEIIAHHLTEANQPSEAVAWWQRAGLSAIQRSANVEAIAHLRTALGLLRHLPDAAVAEEHELNLRVLLGVPLTLTMGWAHPEVGSTYQEARKLCDKLHDSRQQLPTRVGVATYYIVRGQFRSAQEMALKTLQVAEATDELENILEAELDCGTTAFYLSEYARALHHLDRVERLYVPERHYSHAFTYGKDPFAVALVHRAMALACTGRVEEALATANHAVEHTAHWPHPFSRLWALIGLAITNTVIGESERAAEVAVTIAEEAEQQKFPNWLAQAFIYQGLGQALAGQADDGIQRIRQGLELWGFTGAELGVPILANLLVKALLLAGQPDAARSEWERAEALTRRTEERWAEPFQIILRGDIELAASGLEAAEPWYLRAATRAHETGARTFEIAAIVALGKACLLRGRAQRAKELVEGVIAGSGPRVNCRYATEGKALLAQLVC